MPMDQATNSRRLGRKRPSTFARPDSTSSTRSRAQAPIVVGTDSISNLGESDTVKTVGDPSASIPDRHRGVMVSVRTVLVGPVPA